MNKITPVEEALAAVDEFENDLTEKISEMRKLSDEALMELLTLSGERKDSAFRCPRFKDAVVMESLRRVLKKLAVAETNQAVKDGNMMDV